MSGQSGPPSPAARLVVLISGGGSNLQAILDACLLTESELASLNWQDLDDPFAGVL